MENCDILRFSSFESLERAKKNIWVTMGNVAIKWAGESSESSQEDTNEREYENLKDSDFLRLLTIFWSRDLRKTRCFDKIFFYSKKNFFFIGQSWGVIIPFLSSFSIYSSLFKFIYFSFFLVKVLWFLRFLWVVCFCANIGERREFFFSEGFWRF